LRLPTIGPAHAVGRETCTAHAGESMKAMRARLNDLRERDRKLSIFGSTQHRYISTPVEEAQIARFETRWGVQLPDELRGFLTDIGFGTGPYYGLWNLEGIESELWFQIEDYHEFAEVTVKPSLPFPFGIADALHCREMMAARVPERWLFGTWPCNGCPPIAHHGCTAWSVIVTSGECVGTIWDFGAPNGFEAMWYPATRAPGLIGREYPKLPELAPFEAAPTFGQWYEGWIIRCEADLNCWSNYRLTRGQPRP
jgi:SMI1/KNR4 family protein SUKH-1